MTITSDKLEPPGDYPAGTILEVQDGDGNVVGRFIRAGDARKQFWQRIV